MSFTMYLILSLSLVFLLIFIIYFGRAFFTGAPFAATHKRNLKVLIEQVRKFTDMDKTYTAVDLGSGDGRLVMALAQAGFEGRGYESNPFLVWWSRYRIKKAGLENRAKIHRANFWREDLRTYDIVVLFGIPYMMGRMQEKLQNELKPGSIVASVCFRFPDWPVKRKEGNVLIYRKT